MKDNCLVDINPDAMGIHDLAQLTLGLGKLHRYCEHKHLAMGYRIKGVIGQAQFHENICDEIYKTLPESVKSW